MLSKSYTPVRLGRNHVLLSKIVHSNNQPARWPIGCHISHPIAPSQTTVTTTAVALNTRGKTRSERLRLSSTHFS
jgi:hypothetical protein